MTKYKDIGGQRHRYCLLQGRDSTAVWFDGRTYYIPRSRQSNSHAHPGASGSNEVAALMPGKLLRIDVAVGDTVTEKQPVAVMESMKMETALYASKAGRVAEIRSRPGATLEMGEVILVIE